MKKKRQKPAQRRMVFVYVLYLGWQKYTYIKTILRCAGFCLYFLHQERTPIFIFRRTRTFSGRRNPPPPPPPSVQQKNEKDRGVFTCLLAKNLMFTKNLEDIEWGDNIRSEMGSDLLNLSTTENRVDDLPDNLQWIVQNGF